MNNDLTWQDTIVSKSHRAERYSQKPKVVWFTGLSGSGKSASAMALERALFTQGISTYLLDGDNVRHGLCRDLGFSESDRIENIRRVGEVAKLMLDSGLLTLCSFISPFQRDRDLVRSLFKEGEFIEVYVKTPLSICELRDVKGLYKKARAGEIQDFTGVSSRYEPPLNPEITIDTSIMKINDVVDYLISQLRQLRIVP